MTQQTIPLSSFQIGAEATRGTAVAATRKVPIIVGSGIPDETIERVFPEEVRNSLIASYREPIPTRRMVAVGIQLAPTYQHLPRILNDFCHSDWNGAATTKNGVPTAVTAKKYDFVPLATSDALLTSTLEVGGSTKAYQIPYSLGNHLELGWQAGQAMTMRADYLGQRMVGISAFASNLADVTAESVNGATAIATIDTTTIGTTTVTNVIDARFTLDNGWRQFFALTGNLYPGDAYRGNARFAQLDLTLGFDDLTEYNAFQAATLGSQTERKIRLTMSGSTITGTSPSTAQTLTVNWYGYWQAAPFAEQDGIWTVKLTGRSVYDTTGAEDWSIHVTTNVAMT